MTILFRPQGAFGWFSYTTSRDTIAGGARSRPHPHPPPYTYTPQNIASYKQGGRARLPQTLLARNKRRSERSSRCAAQAALGLPGDAPLPPYPQGHTAWHDVAQWPGVLAVGFLGGGRNRAPPARRIASCARSYVCFWPVTPVTGARDRFVCTTQYRAKRQGARAQIPQK